MAFLPDMRQAERIGVFFEIIIWIVVGSMAMLWWLPERMGEKSTIFLGKALTFMGSCIYGYLTIGPGLVLASFSATAVS
jgi:hypothetical protein